MGNCSPKTFHMPEIDPIDSFGAWPTEGPSILPEPLEAEYTRKPLYEPIWMRPMPPDLEPLKPLKQEFTQDTPFKGKLAPLKLF